MFGYIINQTLGVHDYNKLTRFWGKSSLYEMGRLSEHSSYVESCDENHLLNTIWIRREIKLNCTQIRSRILAVSIEI